MARSVILILLGACLPLAGCDTVAIALLGGGATTLLRYNLDGVAARTFTAPAAAVKSASLAAMERMGLALEGTDKFDNGEILRARAPNREIEVELEPITRETTRMRITARGGGMFYDHATAIEIVQQTVNVLDAGVAAKLTPPAAAASGTSRVSAN
jgi:hypothetical protein